MSDKHNVFISWSGLQSRFAADALRAWLPTVLQSARPWMSEEDIDKGSRGLDEIGKALDGMKIGIICLTPENLDARWILYEAGALSKSLDAKTRVCTYLLAGLQPQNIQPPLGMFQATRAEKDETRRLVHAINRALDGDPVSSINLDATFDGVWPRLEEKLSAIPKSNPTIQTTRTTDEMLAELLENSRAEANRRRKSDDLDKYLPILDDLMPVLSDALKTRSANAHSGGIAALSGNIDLLSSPQFDILPGRITPRNIYRVKIEYDDDIKKIEGTAAIQDAPGRLFIYDGPRPVARFADKVENWWTEPLL